MYNYTAPGVVEITDVVTISSSASNVTWNPPIEPNGIITGYEVIYSVHGRSTENVIGPLDSGKNSLDIMNLSKFTLIVCIRKNLILCKNYKCYL